MLYFTNFRQILEGERRFNRHVIPLNHLLFSHVFVKHLNTVLCKTFFLSAVKKHLYCGKIKLIAFLIGVFPGGKGGLCVRLTTLPPSCAVVMKSGNLNFLEPSGPLQACNGTAFTVYFLIAFLISTLGVSELSAQLHNLTILTYLLTPWGRVLLEKLTGSAASQEIPRIFGTRRFLTVLTSARHLSLS